MSCVPITYVEVIYCLDLLMINMSINEYLH